MDQVLGVKGPEPDLAQYERVNITGPSSEQVRTALVAGSVIVRTYEAYVPEAQTTGFAQMIGLSESAGPYIVYTIAVVSFILDWF